MIMRQTFCDQKTRRLAESILWMQHANSSGAEGLNRAGDMSPRLAALYDWFITPLQAGTEQRALNLLAIERGEYVIEDTLELFAEDEITTLSGNSSTFSGRTGGSVS
jgi:hypothetical protein